MVTAPCHSILWINPVIQDVRSIPFSQLKQEGIRAMAYDKDNCLTAPYVTSIHPPFKVRPDHPYTLSKVYMPIGSMGRMQSNVWCTKRRYCIQFSRYTRRP